MAKKKKTVEQLSKEFHERERLAYEKRTAPSEIETETEVETEINDLEDSEDAADDNDNAGDQAGQ